MQSVRLNRAIILAAAIALGCVSVTIDASARGGVGGAGGAGGRGVGHAAPSGAASGHASTASRGISAGGPSHFSDGAAMMRVGHGYVPE
jgi:hypothetical protein